MIEKGILIEGGDLANQCYKNYLHGKKPELEKQLGKIEGHTATVFKKLDEDTHEAILPQQEINQIRLFTLIQHSRTIQFSQLMKNTFEKLLTEVARVHLEAKYQEALGEEDTKVTYGVNTLKHIESMINVSPVAIDLEFTLLINDTDIEFITSDNPAVFYNQFLASNFSGSTIGLTSKGLQIFYPISPTRTIHFYDKNTYNVRQTSCQITRVVNSRDVIALNTLQFCAAGNNIYFRDVNFNVGALVNRANKYRARYRTLLASSDLSKNEANLKVRLVASTPEIRTDLKLTFSSVIKSARKIKKDIVSGKDRRNSIPRDQHLIDLNSEFQKHRLKGTYQIHEFGEFLRNREKLDA